MKEQKNRFLFLFPPLFTRLFHSYIIVAYFSVPILEFLLLKRRKPIYTTHQLDVSHDLYSQNGLTPDDTRQVTRGARTVGDGSNNSFPVHM